MSAVISQFLLLLGIFAISAAQPRDASTNAKCCENYCYFTDTVRPQVHQFSTKTAYQTARTTGNQYNVPNCTPSKFWLLSRHGTRLNSAKSMVRLQGLEAVRDEVIRNYEVLQNIPETGALCDGDLDLLKRWTWDTNITENHENYLTTQGWNDLKGLAQHYKAAYADIFSSSYSADRYYFRRTDTQRTEASLKGFVDGLFGDNSWDWLPPHDIPGQDTLLRPYEFCPAWEEQNDQIDEAGSEYSKFTTSSLYLQTISDISRRLGFTEDLSMQTVENMFDACRFEQAWYLNRISTWCTAFTKSQVTILEYQEDLNYYYKSGYGGPLNSNIACEAVADMVTRMDAADGPAVTAYFTHSSMLQVFMTALGVAKDATPLRADNFQQMSDRQWKTSIIGPFTTNVAAVRYDCPQDSQPVKVAFFLNEKMIPFEWCNADGLCDITSIKERFNTFTEGSCENIFCKSSQTILRAGLVVIVSSLFLLATQLM